MIEASLRAEIRPGIYILTSAPTDRIRVAGSITTCRDVRPLDLCTPLSFRKTTEWRSEACELSRSRTASHCHSRNGHCGRKASICCERTAILASATRFTGRLVQLRARRSKRSIFPYTERVAVARDGTRIGISNTRIQSLDTRGMLQPMKLAALIICVAVGIYLMALARDERFNWRGKDEYRRNKRR